MLRGTSPVIIISIIIFPPAVAHYLHQCGQLFNYISLTVLGIIAFCVIISYIWTSKGRTHSINLYHHAIDNWGSVLCFLEETFKKGYIYLYMLLKSPNEIGGNSLWEFSKAINWWKITDKYIYYKYLLWPMISIFLLSAFHPKVRLIYKYTSL